MRQIEIMVQEPTSSPEELILIVANLSSPSVEGPRELPPELVEKLYTIAYEDGNVALHSRMFAEWLHYAFPADCPFPNNVSGDALSMGHWINASSNGLKEMRNFHTGQGRNHSDNMS